MNDLASTNPDLSGQTLFDMAGALSIAAAAVRENSRIPKERKTELVDRYGDRVMQWLGRARDLGIFQEAKLVEEFKNEPVFNAFASRPDFQKFVASLEKK